MMHEFAGGIGFLCKEVWPYNLSSHQLDVSRSDMYKF